MKTFLVTLKLTLGGYEKYNCHLISASSAKAAQRQALKNECHEEEKGTLTNDSIKDINGEFAYCIQSCQPVDKYEETILRKFIE